MINCLAQVMKDAGITRSELAKSSGFNLNRINRLIDNRANISPAVAQKIVNSLKMGPEKVFFRVK